MSKPKLECSNCNQLFEAHYPYCPYCGQQAEDKLTLGVLFRNTISNYFSFDARFFKSFLPLMVRPGYLAKRFLNGQRLLYLHPAQMYLFISVVFFFILSFTVNDLANEADSALKKEKEESKEKLRDSISESQPALDSIQMDKLMKPLKVNQKKLGIKDEDLLLADSIMKIEQKKSNNVKTVFNYDDSKVDSLIDVGADDAIIYKEMGMPQDADYFTRKFYSQLLKFQKNRGAGSIITTFFNSVPIAMFFLLPMFALILKIFYFKKGNYTHHLVFSFYFFSYLFTVFSIIFGLNMILDIPDWIDWLVAISTFFYLFLAIKNFYKQHWFLSWFKTGMITFIFLSMVIPTTFILLLGFSFLFY